MFLCLDFFCGNTTSARLDSSAHHVQEGLRHCMKSDGVLVMESAKHLLLLAEEQKSKFNDAVSKLRPFW